MTIIKIDSMKFNLRVFIVLLALCPAIALISSCGTSVNVPHTETVTQVYGSPFDGAPQIFSRYLPSSGIAEDSKIKFQTSSTEKGLKVMNYHFESLFGSPQDISVIEINPRMYRFNVANHVKLVRTSEIASEAGAVAAMNGTFYDMKKGGSVCYLQIDGVVADTTKGKDMKVRANGAVVIKKGKLSVEPWNADKESIYKERFLKGLNRIGYPEETRHSESVNAVRSGYGSGVIRSQKNVSIMATMPLLIKDGYAVELPYYKGFSDKRHPRSVVFEKDGKICLMVIDGRSKGNAAGMTLDEVQRYLLSMDGGKGCQNAVNLDGGGSSTLWLKPSSGEKYSNGAIAPEASIQGTGVINHPSDNGKFDHKGERRVANSIIVLRK